MKTRHQLVVDWKGGDSVDAGGCWPASQLLRQALESRLGAFSADLHLSVRTVAHGSGQTESGSDAAGPPAKTDTLDATSDQKTPASQVQPPWVESLEAAGKGTEQTRQVWMAPE